MFDVVHAHRRYIFANGLGTRLRLLVNGLHEAGRDSNHDHQEGCGRPALTAPGGYSVQGEPAMRLLSMKNLFNFFYLYFFFGVGLKNGLVFLAKEAFFLIVFTKKM